LPSKLVGTHKLAETPGWKVVYTDPLATLLVRDAGRFPKLAGMTLPVIADENSIRGREPFPRNNPRMERKRVAINQ